MSGEEDELELEDFFESFPFHVDFTYVGQKRIERLRAMTGDPALEPEQRQSATQYLAHRLLDARAYADAVALYDQIMAGEDDTYHTSFMPYQRARAYVGLGDMDAAVADLDRAYATRCFRRDGESATVRAILFLRARIAVHQGRLDDALADAERIQGYQADDARHAIILALHREAEGRDPEDVYQAWINAVQAFFINPLAQAPELLCDMSVFRRVIDEGRRLGRPEDVAYHQFLLGFVMDRMGEYWHNALEQPLHLEQGQADIYALGRVLADFDAERPWA